MNCQTREPQRRVSLTEQAFRSSAMVAAGRLGRDGEPVPSEDQEKQVLSSSSSADITSMKCSEISNRLCSSQ